MTKEHAPTHGMRLPWHDEGSYVADADGQTVTLNHYRTHIVKCVNMHDELVGALKYVAKSGKFTSFDDLAWDVVNEALEKAGAL